MVTGVLGVSTLRDTVFTLVTQSPALPPPISSRISSDMFQARDIMELPPDPSNNPHLDAELQRFRSGFQPILPEDDDTPQGKRKASLTAAESAKAAKIESLAQYHGRKCRTPEPSTRYGIAGPFRTIPGADSNRGVYPNPSEQHPTAVGPGPYYPIVWNQPFEVYQQRYDLYTGETVPRPSSADLVKVRQL